MYNDASFKIKNKIIDIRNQSDSPSAYYYYIFNDGIILNTFLMVDSNTYRNYVPFIQMRYDSDNNYYFIRIISIIVSDSGGNNFSNSITSPGTVIIYYI